MQALLIVWLWAEEKRSEGTKRGGEDEPSGHRTVELGQRVQEGVLGLPAAGQQQLSLLRHSQGPQRAARVRVQRAALVRQRRVVHEGRAKATTRID